MIMKKNYFFTFLFLSISFSLFSQNNLIGVLTDSETGEELIGVNVIYSGGGTTSEFDGSYSLELQKGEYEITFSYVGYQTIIRNITMESESVRMDLKMSSGEILTEINVTADIAIQRKTPVAFSNIPTLKLQEELAAQDIPMILNSTPGAYATTSGGGDGDARITIRGFSQRNVAVMLDGIPVNDMENGWVYWSNWFGLDLVTKTIQVQRGLGASKLAIPSVGGTINILTKGIEAKRSGRLRQEFGNDGYLRTTFGLTSGRLKNGWGVSLAGSYKQGDGYVDGAFTKGYFYYLRVDKQAGKHLFSFSGFGAPQKHGQRPFKQAIALYDTDVAKDLGIPQENIDATVPNNRGIKFNEYSALLNGEEVNTNYNFYHKPQFSLRHSVQASEKLFFSNVAYLSIGKGGGAFLTGPSLKFDIETGKQRSQDAYDYNQETNFIKTDLISENIIQASMNEHFWYGLLSTTQYNMNENVTISGGLDLRSYEGSHYRRLDDLFGGEYYLNAGNRRVDPLTRLQEKDRMSYDNKGFVRWGGLFGLVEFEKGRWSTFVNLSGSLISYKLEDYMKPKTFTIGEEEYFVSYNSKGVGVIPDGPVIIDETIYTVDEPSENTIAYAQDQGLSIDSNTPQNQQIDWITYSGFTFKTGASYKLNEKMSVFANMGVLSKAQSYTNVIRDNRNDANRSPVLWGNIENEKVYATELGYNFKSSNFTANVNTYFTLWKNKPVSGVFDTNPEDLLETIPVNVNGMGARHMGLELDLAWKLSKQLKIEGLASIADWIWNSDASYESQFTTTPQNFYPKGVHVGDAAQLQFGGLVRYEPIKSLYFSVRGTFFGKNFSSFNPESLQSELNREKDSWQMPDYFLLNLNAGYSIKVKEMRIGLRFNVINLLDAVYIADAGNNDTRAGIPIQQSTFDAKSASVYFGQGRQWSTGLTISF
jgi:iron complex outermembrane receptor protein